MSFRYAEENVLNIDRLSLGQGQSLTVLGPSGCGKTTLLHLLAGLIRATEGTVKVLGQDLAALPASQVDRFRGRHIGLVFQRFHLMPALTVRENILLAQQLASGSTDPTRMQSLLEQMDILELQNRRPSALSHGQAQRVAIARALAHRPQLVMADEPTSALDDQRANQALDLLCECTESIGAALVVVTHDRRLRGWLDQELTLGSEQ